VGRLGSKCILAGRKKKNLLILKEKGHPNGGRVPQRLSNKRSEEKKHGLREKKARRVQEKKGLASPGDIAAREPSHMRAGAKGGSSS